MSFELTEANSNSFEVKNQAMHIEPTNDTQDSDSSDYQETLLRLGLEFGH